MAEQHLHFSDALGASCTDEVFRKHLRHRCARNARDERHIDAAERERRQDQVRDPPLNAFVIADVALRRQQIEL